MSADPWHFARPDLAERLLGSLTSGPSRALTLFGPRRIGKTEFLLHDLVPLARHRRHRVVYVSFWRSTLSPLAVLLHALESALVDDTWDDRLRSGVKAVAPKLTLSAPVPGLSLSGEIDLTKVGPTPPTELLLYLDDLLGRVSRRRRVTLLLLDEVQELAKEESNAPLVAALRTSLDVRSASLRAVFTGSSREGLRAMFSHREAPFFHFATPIDLPSLGTGFVDHLLAMAERTSGREVAAPDEALDAFESLHRNPYFFRLMIERLVLEPELVPSAALDLVRGQLGDELGYADVWLGLTPLQRAVLRVLTEREDKIFGAAARAGMAEALGEENVTSARVQRALKTLARANVVDAFAGRWTFADPGFGEWVGRHGEV